MTFLSMNAHKNNANGRFSQEKWLRSRHFVTMVTCRHTSPLYYVTIKAAMELVGSGRVALPRYHLTLHTKGWISKRGITNGLRIETDPILLTLAIFEQIIK